LPETGVAEAAGGGCEFSEGIAEAIGVVTFTLDARRCLDVAFAFGAGLFFGDFVFAGGDDAVAVGVGVLATGVDADTAGAGDGVETAAEPGVCGAFRLPGRGG